MPQLHVDIDACSRNTEAVALEGCGTDAPAVRAGAGEEYTRPAAGGPARRLLVESAADAARSPVGPMIEMIPGCEALVAVWASPHVELRSRVR